MKTETFITDLAKLALWRAADYIEQHGHCQDGDGRDDSGGACVIAAMYFCGYSHSERMAACDVMNPHLSHLHSVPSWSDSTPTPIVLAKLREIALS